MGIADWLRVFRALHEKAKAGGLSAEDAAVYRDGCDELARALMASQKLTPRAGEAPRHALRVARALQIDLESAASQVRALTVEIGATGFSAILGKAPPAGGELRCTLKLPGGTPLCAAAVPAEVRPSGGATRVSFAFAGLSGADRERLELLVIDTALSQLAA